MNDITLPVLDLEHDDQAVQHHWLRVLHWSTAIVLLVAVASVLLREVVDDKATRMLLMDCHRSAGVLVLILLSLRIVVRHTQDFLHATTLTVLETRVSTLVHLALYAAMLGVPALGLLLTSAQGKIIKLFGVLPLPKLLGTDPDLADTLSDWHENIAWVFVALIALHIAAALFHHFVRRDNVLNAMLGRRSMPGSRS